MWIRSLRLHVTIYIITKNNFLKFFGTKKIFLIFAPAYQKQCRACGVIGSRARLRIWCRETCRFESYHAHNITYKSRQKPPKSDNFGGFSISTKSRHKKIDFNSVTFSGTVEIEWGFVSCSRLRWPMKPLAMTHATGCVFTHVFVSLYTTVHVGEDNASTESCVTLRPPTH